nr:leaf rust 10 disease-resistance locus receptor-like protein kinase-like 1.2 [Quercus suber]
MEAHHLALSSLITLSFFLAILPPSYCTEDARFVECSHLYERGRIKNVYYPFWGGNQTEYCGRQGFKLECYNNEYPIIKFEELEFLILNISESQDVMTIARLDLCGGSCLETNLSTVLNYSTVVDYRYPFWVHNESASDQQYCGYPGFGIMCLNGTAVLEIHGDRYHVKDINYADYTLSLVDIDVSNQTCPRPRARHSVSLETLPLKYSSIDLNLSFYFNCTSDPAITVPPIPCLNVNGSYRHSYVFVENHETEGYDWSKNCEEKAVVTVRHIQTEINIEDLIDRFGGAMNDGFVLDWERVKDCVACENSEGYCGYNATAEEFLCFCNDGSTHRNSCKDF